MSCASNTQCKIQSFDMQLIYHARSTWRASLSSPQSWLSASCPISRTQTSSTLCMNIFSLYATWPMPIRAPSSPIHTSLKRNTQMPSYTPWLQNHVPIIPFSSITCSILSTKNCSLSPTMHYSLQSQTLHAPLWRTASRPNIPSGSHVPR
jgi:hypothetical protein